MCVCERERERARERGRESDEGGKGGGANPVRQHEAWLRASDFECRVEVGTHRHPCGDTALAICEHRPETEEPRRHRLFTEALRIVDSGGVGKRNKFLLLRFFKKSGKSFLKKRKVKKKSGIPPKSGRLTSLEYTSKQQTKHLSIHPNITKQTIDQTSEYTSKQQTKHLSIHPNNRPHI